MVPFDVEVHISIMTDCLQITGTSHMTLLQLSKHPQIYLFLHIVNDLVECGGEGFWQETF